MSRRLAYQGHFLEVWREEAELPGGGRTSLDIVRHPGAAAVVPFATDEEVLLIRQYRHAAGGTIWEIPAGKLDGGEDPEVCARRELQEEIGQRAGRMVRLGSALMSPGFTDEVIHLFAAHDLTSVPASPEDDEVIEVVPTRLEDALELVWSEALVDAKSALALIHAARQLGVLA